MLQAKCLIDTWVYDVDGVTQIGILKASDEQHEVLYKSDKWIQFDVGWCKIVYDDDDDTCNFKITDSEATEEPEESSTDTIKLDSSNYADSTKIDYSKYSSGDLLDNLEEALAPDVIKDFLTNARGIHGMPYQWMKCCDPKVNDTAAYGREFSETIVSRMPILLLSPCRPSFMEGATDKQKEDVMQYMADGLKNSIDELLGDEKTPPGLKYYSLDYAYSEYYQYLNPMLQAAAIYLGIGDKDVYGSKLSSYDWSEFTNPALSNFVSSNESIAFYIDSETQVSESFSNTTGDSSIASKVNDFSDLSNEVQFLLGGLSGLDMQKFQSGVEATKSDVEAFSNKYLKNNSITTLMSNVLGSGLTTVLAGGKMIFPEIWKDSSYSNDYDITVKLRTPDADPLSWYLNICVPMMALVAMVAPKSMGPNAYKAPFLVKGFYKSMINCQYGIITSMNITKGDKAKWTTSGLPTQVDINFTLKDLYKTLTLTKTSEGIVSMDFIKNTYLLDWIGNNCGININKPDVIRSIKLYTSLQSNNIKNKVTFNGFTSVKETLTNLSRKYF